jgi:hypothetical protein
VENRCYLFLFKSRQTNPPIKKIFREGISSWRHVLFRFRVQLSHPVVRIAHCKRTTTTHLFVMSAQCKNIAIFQKLTILASKLLFERRYRCWLLLRPWFFLRNLPAASLISEHCSEYFLSREVVTKVMQVIEQNFARYCEKSFHMRHPARKQRTGGSILSENHLVQIGHERIPVW